MKTLPFPVFFKRCLAALIILFCATPAFAQVLLKGKVTSDIGEPLVGVNVLLKGTNVGTVTNGDGIYSITVPERAGTSTLVFSFIGFAFKEVAIGTQRTINVLLAPEAKALGEVVVVGYGSQEKRNITGAVSTVSSKDFQNTMVTNVGQALQGRTPGVQVIQNTGRPGDASIVRVRGVGTIGNSNPLYVIDGQVTEGGITNINPDDIESMTVLKDAASSAIYGARAANGVVIISTKRGKSGQSKVNFNSYYGTQKAWKLPPMANAHDFAMLQNEARTNAGLPVFWNKLDTLGQGTDKVAEIFQTAPVQNYNLSISGGSEKSQYAVSLGYLDQKGIGIGITYKRYSVNFTSDNQVSKKLKFGNSLSLSKGVDRGGRWDETYKMAMRLSPTIPTYLPDGSYGYPTQPGETIGFYPSIPIAFIFQDDHITSRLLGNIYGEYQFSEYLKLRATIGLDFTLADATFFTPTYQFGSRSNAINALDRSDATSTTWLNENTLSYDRTFNNKHAVSALVGVTQQANRSDNISSHRESFPNNDLRVLNAGALNDQARGSASEWSLLSFLARVNYGFDNKYLFSANLRADGSSRFGSGNRFGIFPSFAAAWRISGEKFMEDVNYISDLKIRASWGQLGNQEIGLYSYATGLNLGQNYVLGTGQTIAPGVAPISLGNPDIKWETTTMSNLGVDLALLKNKITVTAEYYVKNTSDMLVQVPIPNTTGVSGAPYQNAGAVRNTGFEFSVGYQNSAGAFRYNVNANFSTVRNVVTSLAGLPIISSPFKTAEGQPINSIFGFVQEGIFQTQADIAAHANQPGAKPGDIEWKDINNDKVINDDDRTYIGNTIPRLTYGFTANLSYKQFDFSMFIQGVQGYDVFLGNYGRRLGSNADNMTEQYLARWTGPGTSNHVPRLVWGDPSNNSRNSTFEVENGSYLRLKNLQIGYTLPKGIIGLSRLRFYISSQNLLTVTKYPWFDPEVAGGIDNSSTRLMTYPQARTFIFGVNLGI